MFFGVFAPSAYQIRQMGNRCFQLEKQLKQAAGTVPSQLDESNLIYPQSEHFHFNQLMIQS